MTPYPSEMYPYIDYKTQPIHPLALPAIRPASSPAKGFTRYDAPTEQILGLATNRFTEHDAPTEQIPLPATHTNIEWNRSANEEGTTNLLLLVIQPVLVGLMDGSVSMLAPIFFVAFATHNSFTVLPVCIASAIAGGIIIAISEAFSDNAGQPGQGNSFVRGGITGLATFLSGASYMLAFLLPNIQLTLYITIGLVVAELFLIAIICHRFLGTRKWLSITQALGTGILTVTISWLLVHA